MSKGKLVLSSSHSLSVDVHKFGLFITAMAKMKFQLRFWQIYMYKVTTTRTLMRRAQLVCDLHSRLQNGTAYLNHLFKAKTTTTQTLLDGKPTVTSIPTLRLTLTLPLLQQWLTTRAPYEPIVSYTTTLRHTRCTQTDKHFTTTVKDKDRHGAVYKIKCGDCQVFIANNIATYK